MDSSVKKKSEEMNGLVKKVIEKYELVFKVDKKENYIRLLGNQFFIRNKSSGLFIHKNKGFNLIEQIEIKNIKSDKYELSLIFFDNIYNKSQMFKDCNSLLSFSISKKDFSHVILSIDETNNEFYKERNSENEFAKKLSNLDPSEQYSTSTQFLNKSNNSTIESILNDLHSALKDEIKFEIKLTEMFSNCTSLISLSCLYKWNSYNITDMKGMFKKCKSLKSLPDTFKLDTDKVKDMSELFYDCSSLETLPDISDWILSNAIDINAMFYNCSSLKSLPDLSKWKIGKVFRISQIFHNCKILKSLPDISEWNPVNLQDISGIFEGCSSLISLLIYQNGIQIKLYI